MTFGKWPKDAPVLIGQVDSAWYVIGAAQTLTAITALQRANGKIQYKTTPALVFIVGDEDAEWADMDGQTNIATQTVLRDREKTTFTKWSWSLEQNMR
jgi:hypothetical protein